MQIASRIFARVKMVANMSVVSGGEGFDLALIGLICLKAVHAGGAEIGFATVFGCGPGECAVPASRRLHSFPAPLAAQRKIHSVALDMRKNVCRNRLRPRGAGRTVRITRMPFA